jgi:hypothetical protein
VQAISTWQVGALIGILLWGPAAMAQGRPDRTQAIEGVVVHVEQSEVVVALGSEQGLPPQARVEVYRRVQVTHPTTRETLTDRFLIGEMLLGDVGHVLSIASNFNELRQRPAVGDFVVYRPPFVPAPPPVVVVRELEPSAPVQAAEPQGQAAKADGRSPELVTLHRELELALASPITARIARWEIYLADYPDSPYAILVDHELNWLRNRLMEERTQAQERAPSTQPEPRKLPAEAYAPRRTYADRPIHIVAAIGQPDRAEDVRVLVKRDDQTHYETISMERAGDYHWRLALDEAWRIVGGLHYFVEVLKTDGEIELVAGTASRPREVTLEEPVKVPADTENRSRARASFDFVNFRHQSGQDDQFFRFEADFRYAIRGFSPLVAFRTGVGTYQGSGGNRLAIEGGERSREMSLGYGYVDTEFGLHELFSLSTRFVLGTGQATDRRTNYETLGMRLEMRLGEEDGMRLLGGFSLTQEIGNEAWIEFIGNITDRVPLLAAVIVTNLPVGAELGVSLQGGAGYALTDRFALMARVGWNARTINYYGPSLGLGTVLNW